MGLNDAWLATLQEDALEPDLKICDTHHHLWGRDTRRSTPEYLLHDFLSDIDTGHNIVSTVFIDSHTMYRADGPEALRPVGEVEFANGIAAMSASGKYGSTRVAAAIIGHADMRRGAAVCDLLDAQIAAAPQRFRGIRHSTTYDPFGELKKAWDSWTPGLLLDDAFRQGVDALGRRGLVFEAWCYHTQLAELCDLARAVPGTRIILNYCGGPLGVGPYRDKRSEVDTLWREGIAALAKHDNLVAKIGGTNMPVNGHDWQARKRPPTSDELLAASRHYLEHTIESFGVGRCMFESNYPAERVSCGYGSLWNSFKKLTKDYSRDEKAKLYHDNAVRIYRIGNAAV